LARIEARPDAVGPDRRRNALLRRLAERLEGRLAVVSGRTLEQIDAILEGATASAAGVHGLERRGFDGTVTRMTPHPGLADAGARFGELAAGQPGLIVEEKGLSLTLHYRLAPQAAAMVRSEAEALANNLGLVLQCGDMVVELKTPGADKGSAVRTFMAEPPFAGTVPVFVGDDLTDEDGVRAAAALGGYGVLVGPPRATAAVARLDDVEAVLDWMAAPLKQGRAGG
jgi:trehalose 6-phosphate phosphatase